MDSLKDMRKLIMSQDGTKTFYSQRFNDTYHSKFGALEESMHIFIENGLKVIASKADAICILEVGLGTGLNALLTSLNPLNKAIKYTALELYPLTQPEVNQLNYFQVIGHEKAEQYFKGIHQVGWGEFEKIDEHFELCKINKDVKDFNTDDKYDLIYFDAFSPTAQPEMWSAEIFRKMACFCKKGAVLITYCSKGEVRRHLVDAGFNVLKIPGPTGKREITQAVYQGR